jgi:hypothetical protein
MVRTIHSVVLRFARPKERPELVVVSLSGGEFD